MSNYFKVVLTIILFLISLNYTNKVIEYFQNKDPLMKEIKSKANDYYQEPIDAIITENIVIKETYGQKINIKKSYQKMKPLGVYNESLLVYESVLPTKSYLNRFDKVIIPRGNDINLVFEINDDESLFDSINNILEENNIFGSVMNSNFNLANTNFKSLLSTNYSKNIDYCLSFNTTINKDCESNKKYTILIKEEIISSNFLNNTKKAINNHSNIIIYHLTLNTLSNLSIIIKYLKSNQFNIVNIDHIMNF